MSNIFMPLDCDDDIIQIANDSFTVSRLKELVITGIRGNEPQNIGNNTNISFKQCIQYLGSFKLYAETIYVDDLLFQIVKDCQILRIGGKSWQKGKIKIKMSISPRNNSNYVDLEFCPHQPETAESPLDDLRQSLNNI
jgi:KGK domain